MDDPTTDTDGVLDLLIDDMWARETLIDAAMGEESVGGRWAARDSSRTAIEAFLRNHVLLTRAAAILLREDVTEAREEGLSWDRIAEALDITAAEAEARYGTPLG